MSVEMEWVDCFDDYKKHIGSLSQWTVRISPHCRADDLMAAPELMDPKTDPFFSWQEHPPLEVLLDRNLVPDPSKFTEEEIIEMMDVLLVQEAMYCSGLYLSRTLYTCVYLHGLKLLVSCPVLHAFCTALVKCLDLVVNVALLADVREDDEFNIITAELDHFMRDTSVKSIIDELNNVVQCTQNPEIVQRLRVRAEYLMMLDNFKAPSINSVMEAQRHADAVLTMLKALSRSSEPKIDKQVFFDSPGTWLPSITPHMTHPLWSFAETMNFLERMFEQYSLACTFPSIDSLPKLIGALESFSNLRPSLPVRSRLLTIVFNADERLTILFGDTMPKHVLNTLATTYGAPLYKLIAEGDSTSLHDVAQYASARLIELSVAQEQLPSPTSAQIVVNHWVKDFASRFYIELISALLCNRARCHRRLANLLPELARTQQFSYDIDTRTFWANSPYGSQTSDIAQTWANRSYMLTNFINDLILFVEDTYLTLTMELGLLTRAELIPAVWYRNYLVSARLENASLMCIPSPDAIPPRRLTRKNVPLIAPVVTSRKFVLPTILAPVTSRCEIVRMFANTWYTVAAVLSGHKLLDLSLPTTSIVDPSVLWNHRFECFQKVPRPQFHTYRQTMSQYKQFAEDDLKTLLPQSIEAFECCRERAKKLLSTSSDSALTIFLNTAVKESIRNLVALKLVADCWNEATQQVEVDPTTYVLDRYTIDVDYETHSSLVLFNVKLKH